MDSYVPSVYSIAHNVVNYLRSQDETSGHRIFAQEIGGPSLSNFFLIMI